jgi:hypothetical protein
MCKIYQFLFFIVFDTALNSCKKEDIDVPFTYASDSFEAPSQVYFKCTANKYDSLRWFISENLSNTQSQRPNYSSLIQKDITTYFYTEGTYNVSLDVFLDGQEQKFSKNIKIFPSTTLDVTLYNQNNQIIRYDYDIELFNTEKDAQLRQNFITKESYSNGRGITIIKLKPQKYFLRIRYAGCVTQTLDKSLDKVWETEGIIKANKPNEISVDIIDEQGTLTLKNSRGDSKVKVYICRAISCNSPSSDTKPTYIIEPLDSVTFKAPIGIIGYFYNYDSGFGGFESANVKCGEPTIKTIGF